LIRQIKQELQNKGKTFSCLAPTNLAAINIRGTTVHKFVSKLKKMDSLYNFDVDYLFIDEISMLQEIFYKFFIIRKNLKLIKTTITQHHSNRTLTTRPRYGIRPNCIKPRSASGATSDIRELTSFGSKTFCLT
jgi:hypothetical protein